MDFNEYQEFTRTTALWPNRETDIVYPALELADESGEVLGKIKKVIRDKGGEFSISDKLEIAKELGDVLYPVASLAYVLGFDLQTIVDMNYEKLSSRQKRGKLQGSGDDR